ncbi:type II toxin-antitoxin system Phd/YefM family antitoxin [Kumtagia ephedrae]|uniref:Antitoxin n=1 Tax=Kumtagia ephedrae TaxID=2116701 RepID=A0A2P7SJM0_9HYPH|nr:type II toxin-antitoxin system prevent-host-death family antitoxin [Mesorhizobium ephedrae]PSJ62551.1 prevent-host-death protein [Mesorhizobium ephedrae]
MPYVTFTDLRNNLATHLDRVEDDRAELVVTRQGHDPVVIVSLAEWEGMKETLHLLSSPANAERLLQSIAEADAGKLVEHELIDP